MKKLISVLVIMLLLCDIFRLPVKANSAQRRWYGSDGTGILVRGEECPLEVANENLTFDVTEFPRTRYERKSDFLAYKAKVTAEYTFYNPADYEVKATLVFPFRYYPDYGYKNYEKDAESFVSDTEKYDIKVNGKKIDKKLRYTFEDGRDEFSIKQSLDSLQDDFVKDSFYSPDITVTKYTYNMYDVDKEEGYVSELRFEIPPFDGKRKFLLEKSRDYYAKEDGSSVISIWAENNINFNLYVIGEPLASAPEFSFYRALEGGKMVKAEGKTKLLNTESSSLMEFIKLKDNENLEISESDLYNAVIAMFSEFGDMNTGAITSQEIFDDKLSYFLMRWYEYEIVVGPKEKLVNTVEAPMYPAIDGSFDPSVYKYTYLLSPASTWADFENLNIDIKTPFHLVDNNTARFTKTDYGYNYKSDKLPEGEFTFSLSESENPKDRWSAYGLTFLAGVITYAVSYINNIWWYIGLAALVVVMMGLLIKRMRGRRGKE